MKTQRNKEGYLLIDHSNSPGISEAEALAAGLPQGVKAGQGLFESATYTCGHCNSIVIIEPKRTRERGYCRACDSRICDACNLVKIQTLKCHSMTKIIEETLEQTVKADQVPFIN